MMTCDMIGTCWFTGLAQDPSQKNKSGMPIFQQKSFTSCWPAAPCHPTHLSLDPPGQPVDHPRDHRSLWDQNPPWMEIPEQKVGPYVLSEVWRNISMIIWRNGNLSCSRGNASNGGGFIVEVDCVSSWPKSILWYLTTCWGKATIGEVHIVRMLDKPQDLN